MKKIIIIVVVIIGAVAIFRFAGIGSGGERANDISGDAKTRPIKLYYYSPSQDQDAQGNILCSRQGLVAVDREMPVSQTPIQDAVKLLLRGEITAEEKSFGLTTEFPLNGLELKGASLKNGQLTLEFADPNNRTGGGSCRVGILWSQIEETAKQFPEVSSVRFIPEELFQP